MTAERPQAEQESQPSSRYIVPLNSLSSDNYELRRPVNILIEDYGDTVTARLPEFGLYTTDGVSDELALDGLTKDIIDLHQILQSTPDEELGPVLLRQKRGLLSLIAEINPESDLKQSSPEEVLRKRVPLEKLIEGLSSTAIGPKGSPAILTPEVAEHFNRIVGGELGDDVDTSSLIFPLTDVCRRLPEELRDKALAVDPRVKNTYNHAIFPILRAGIQTVGELRSFLAEGSEVRHLGLVGHGFLAVAFRRKA